MNHRLYLTLDKHVAVQLLAQALLGSIKPFLHRKLLQLSLVDLAARPPFLHLHMGPLDRLEAHLSLEALDHLQALQHLGDLDCLEAHLYLGALDHLEALLHLVPLQYLRLPLQSSHPHVDTLSDAVNS